MMTAPKVRDIEVLPQEDWEKTSFGKFLKWTLGVGRYIVIATELIVILAFLSRFKLDRDLTNLYEDIKQKQAIVDVHQDFENNVRFLQKRLTTIDKLEKDQAVNALVLDRLVPLVPLDVSLFGLSVNNQKIGLTAVSLSEQGLASFINNLKKSTQFKNLVLSNVSSGSKKSTGIEFELSSELNVSQR